MAEKSWNLKHITEPALNPIKTTRLLAHQLQSLSKLSASFSKTKTLNEISILEKLVFKNKNQHKSTPYFKKLVYVKRVLTRLKGINVKEMISTLMEQGNLGQIPDQEYFNYVNKKLEGYSSLVNKSREVIRIGYIAFRQLATSTYFLAFCIAVMACLARLDFLMREADDDCKFLKRVVDEMAIVSSAGQEDQLEVEDHLVIPGEQQEDQLEDHLVVSGEQQDQVQNNVKEKLKVKDRREAKRKREDDLKDEIDDIFGF